MTTIQKGIATGLVALTVGTGVYQGYRIAVLTRQIRSTQRAQAADAGQIDQLQRERDQATNELASLRAAAAAVRRDQEELVRLRGQVGQLHKASASESNLSEQDVAAAERRINLAKEQTLRGRVTQVPERSIPEMSLLRESDWLEAAKQADLQTTVGLRKAFADLRSRAKNRFGEQLRGAFRKYAEAHNDQLPAALEELKPFFDEKIGDEVLQRYAYNHTGHWSQLQPGDGLVEEKAHVDFIDSHFSVQKDTTAVSQAVFPPDDVLLRVFDAYFAGDYSKEPNDLAVLESFATTPDERDALRKFIASESGPQKK